MKRLIFSLLSFVLTISIFAQDNAPNSFNWQGVFRSADNILTNTPIEKITFSIIEDLDGCDGTGDTTLAYQEEYTDAMTNQFGLLNLLLGRGRFACW